MSLTQLSVTTHTQWLFCNCRSKNCQCKLKVKHDVFKLCSYTESSCGKVQTDFELPSWKFSDREQKWHLKLYKPLTQQNSLLLKDNSTSFFMPEFSILNWTSRVITRNYRGKVKKKENRREHVCRWVYINKQLIETVE